MTPEDIKRQARHEVEAELFRAAVDAEKARLLAHRSLWSRFLAWLPFTITRKPNGR